MDVKQIRNKHKLNQTEFWGRVGCTQSTGSRYETHRTIPKPVQTLIKIAYGTDAQAAKEVSRLRA